MAESNKVAVSNLVDHVGKRVETLIADHRRVTEINHKLTEERKQLLATKRELQEQLQGLQREMDKKILQEGLENVTRDPKRATAYINRIIREVESCMALISAIK